MFLRKLAVVVLPLLGLLAMAWLSDAAGTAGFWGLTAWGFAAGALVSLLPMAAGESRGHMPFGRWLVLPALLICAALVMQDAGALPMPTLLVQAAEAILAGALAGTAVRAW